MPPGQIDLQDLQRSLAPLLPPVTNYRKLLRQAAVPSVFQQAVELRSAVQQFVVRPPLPEADCLPQAGYLLAADFQPVVADL